MASVSRRWLAVLLLAALLRCAFASESAWAQFSAPYGKGGAYGGAFGGAYPGEFGGHYGEFGGPYGNGYAAPGPGGYGAAAGGYGASGAMSTHVPYFGTTTFSVTGAEDGLGYEGGYVSAQSTFPLWADPLEGWWLIDARASLSEQGEAFTNIGLARRKHFRPLHADFGLGVFFDWDGDQYDDFGHDFYQVGISAHMWTCYFDVNFNGYVPVGDTDFTKGTLGNPFFGNLLLARHGFDSALKGYDVTFALRPESLQQHCGAIHVGTYAFRSDTIDAFAGFHTMISIQPIAGVTVSAGLTADEEFDTNGILQVEVHRGTSRGFSPSGRDLDPFRRNAHIVRAHQSPVFVVNPATGLRYNVVHVDNSVNNNGNGTFERPFNTLADADGTLGLGSLPGDIIFVHNGLSSDALGNPANLTGYNTGISLLEGQLLLGDGIEYNLPSQKGIFTFSNDEDGILPTITNIAGNAVTLANNNRVAGLSIQGFGSGNFGITDSGAGATNTIIDSVRVQGFSAPGGFGVNIDPSINTVILNSTINGNDTNIFLGP